MGNVPRKADGRRVFSADFKRTQVQRLLTGGTQPRARRKPSGTKSSRASQGPLPWEVRASGARRR